MIMAFYILIIRKTDVEILGYCGIKNLNKDFLEIAVKIWEEDTNQSYGGRALKLFLYEFKNKTTIQKFAQG